MGILQSSVRARVGPPVIVGYSNGISPLGSFSEAQVGRAYSSSPSVNGGLLPLTYSFVAGTVPSGLSINTGTGVISGTPTGANGQSYTGTTFGVTVRVTDAANRSNDYFYNIFVYQAPALGFDPSIPRTYASQNSASHGILIQPLPQVTPRNNSADLSPGTWYGPIVTGYHSGFLGANQYEAFAYIQSGFTGGTGTYNQWLNLGTQYNWYSSVLGQLIIELRPVGGATIGGTTFSFQ